MSPQRMGRPRKANREEVLAERLYIPVTAEVREFILANGGAAFVRQLIEQHRSAHDAIHPDDHPESNRR
jgi:hypothetical protein